MAKAETKAWFVRSPVCGLAVVAAPNREQASIKAAEQWGVPWAWVAADLDITQAPDIRRNVCHSCGKIIYNTSDMRCTDCERELREAMKKPSWGARECRKAEKMRKRQEARA